jgi:hypothetical protein
MSWCYQQTLEIEIFTGRQTCRTKKWWGKEAEFYFNKAHVFDRDPIESDPELAALRDRFCPIADSVLLYRYEIGGEIGEHLSLIWLMTRPTYLGNAQLLGFAGTAKITSYNTGR